MKIDPKIYIEDMIIVHLQQFTDGQVSAKEVPWDTMRISLNTCIYNGSAYMDALHTLMQPYYEMYFYGDSKICRNIPGPERVFMEEITKADKDFCLWASNQNLIAAAEGWGDYMKRTNNDHIPYFIALLELLFSEKYHQDWGELAEELKDSLFKAEACSDYKTDELLCILHALAMIMQQDWTLHKKEEMFALLKCHWGFMKHVYSMMTRHIVGCRLSNFAAVANNVMQSNDNLPHIDIFYCALVERMDSMGLDEKKYKKLDDARLKLLEKINRREPSETLYELCDTLFPEEFQLMLRHRPKSYGELKRENEQKDLLLRRMENQTRELEQQLERVTLSYKTAIEASIPVEEILQRLQAIPIATAWDIFNKLDRLLKTHPVWRQYDVKIQEALEQRERKEESLKMRLYGNVETCAEKTTSSTNIENFYNQSGTYNDFSEATIHTLPFPHYKDNPKTIEE